MNEFKGYIPTELIDAIIANRCILFIGAGLSSKVKRTNGKSLPSWKGLLEELLSYAKDIKPDFNNSDDVKAMIESGNFLMAAQELQETIGLEGFGTFLQNAFQHTHIRLSNSHNLLHRIPFKCILTTNYDNLIETAYAKAEDRLPLVFTQDDVAQISTSLRHNNFFIFKIHGDFNRPETIVLGSRDYQKLLFRSPDFRQLIEILFSVYTILFVGYGASDPNLDNVLDKLSGLFAGLVDKHYILMPEKRFNYTEKKRLLIDKSLEVIEYERDDEHSQVDAFIEHLVKKCEERQVGKQKAKPYDIFLSHSSKDEQIANKIISQLKANGYRVWDFQENFKFGDVWQDALSTALNESRYMAFLITDNYSSTSRWLKKEMEIGLLKQIEGKIEVLPIVVDNARMDEFPTEISTIGYLKLDKNFKLEDLKPLFDKLENKNR